MILQADLSSAFKGCTRAYAEIHLRGRTCLDGALHDGSPCLLNDESHAVEAKHLLTHVPTEAHGQGVTLNADGTPSIESEQSNRKAS